MPTMACPHCGTINRLPSKAGKGIYLCGECRGEFRLVTSSRAEKSGGTAEPTDVGMGEIAALLERHITTGKAVEIGYLNRDGIVSRREVSPYEVGVIRYKGNPYAGMRGYCHKRKEIRDFRLDRIIYVKESATEVYFREGARKADSATDDTETDRKTGPTEAPRYRQSPPPAKNSDHPSEPRSAGKNSGWTKALLLVLAVLGGWIFLSGMGKGEGARKETASAPQRPSYVTELLNSGREDQFFNGIGDGRYRTPENLTYWLYNNKGFRYEYDNYRHGGDYYQHPSVTWVTRRGDCDDYAILLLYIFRIAYGIDAEFATVKDNRDGGYHALVFWNDTYFDLTWGVVYPSNRYWKVYPHLVLVSAESYATAMGQVHPPQ